MENEIGLAAKVSVGIGLLIGAGSVAGSLIAHLVALHTLSTELLDIGIVGLFVAALFAGVWSLVHRTLTR